MHWAANYIGVPWEFGGRSIEGFDCWGLFQHIQRERYSIEVSEIELTGYNFHNVVREFDKNEELKSWTEIGVPEDGDGVLLRMAKYPNHVGILIKDEETVGVLHTVEKSGVIFSSYQNLERAGWKVARYYRHRSKI